MISWLLLRHHGFASLDPYRKLGMYSANESAYDGIIKQVVTSIQTFHIKSIFQMKYQCYKRSR